MTESSVVLTQLVYLILETAVVVVARHDTDGLQGLAESHVVAEDAVQLVPVHQSQPVDSSLQTKHFTLLLDKLAM